MVLPYSRIRHFVLPYMVLCNGYKQYITVLESFMSKIMVKYQW